MQSSSTIWEAETKLSFSSNLILKTGLCLDLKKKKFKTKVRIKKLKNILRGF